MYHFAQVCSLVPRRNRLLRAAKGGSTVTPHTSHLTPHTSHPTPHTSHLTPHTSHLTPHTPHPTPHTSHLTPHTSHLRHAPYVPRLDSSSAFPSAPPGSRSDDAYQPPSPVALSAPAPLRPAAGAALPPIPHFFFPSDAKACAAAPARGRRGNGGGSGGRKTDSEDLNIRRVYAQHRHFVIMFYFHW